MAFSGRKGPVFLSLPLDVQGAATSVARMSVNVESRFEVDRSTLHAAVNALVTAQRPLILAGSGTRWDEAPAALRAVARALPDSGGDDAEGQGRLPRDAPAVAGGVRSRRSPVDHGVP